MIIPNYISPLRAPRPAWFFHDGEGRRAEIGRSKDRFPNVFVFWRGAATLLLACAFLIATGSQTNAQNQDDLRRAQKLYEKAVQSKNLKDQTKLLQQAVQLVSDKAAESTNKSNSALSPASRRLAANIHYALGHIFYQQSRWELAVFHLEKTLSIDSTFAAPDGAALYKFLAQAHHALAVQLLAQGKIQAALQSALTALRRDSNLGPAHTTVGLIYFQQGKYDAAIAAYNQALRAAPSERSQSAQLYNNLGAAHEANGDLAAAVQSYRRTLEFEPGLTLAQKNLQRADEKLAAQSPNIVGKQAAVDSARYGTKKRDSQTAVQQPPPNSAKAKPGKGKQTETSKPASKVAASGSRDANRRASEKIETNAASRLNPRADSVSAKEEKSSPLTAATVRPRLATGRDTVFTAKPESAHAATQSPRSHPPSTTRPAIKSAFPWWRILLAASLLIGSALAFIYRQHLVQGLPILTPFFARGLLLMAGLSSAWANLKSALIRARPGSPIPTAMPPSASEEAVQQKATLSRSSTLSMNLIRAWSFSKSAIIRIRPLLSILLVSLIQAWSILKSAITRVPPRLSILSVSLARIWSISKSAIIELRPCLSIPSVSLIRVWSISKSALVGVRPRLSVPVVTFKRAWLRFKPVLSPRLSLPSGHSMRLLPLRSKLDLASGSEKQAAAQLSQKGEEALTIQEELEVESPSAVTDNTEEPRQLSLQTQAFFAEIIAAEPEINEFDEAAVLQHLIDISPENESTSPSAADKTPPAQANKEVLSIETPVSTSGLVELPPETINGHNGADVVSHNQISTPIAIVTSEPLDAPNLNGQRIDFTDANNPNGRSQHRDEPHSASTAKLGRYFIEREIGQGAMGKIYLALDPKLDRRVVIKTVCFNLATREVDTSTLKDRIYREARAIAKLSHPNIVVVYDVEDDKDLSYIVMEHIEGQDLRQVLRVEHLLDHQRAMRIVAQVCSALDYAHRAGIIHRDVKPSNIMLLPGDKAKVTDFGIAKIADNFSLTLPGHVLGTPSYMAPEQFEGQESDGRADIFSLGVVLYELVTGRRPFTGNSLASLAYKIVHKMHIPPSLQNVELPMELDEIIGRALAKNPEERYQTAREFREALLAVPTEVMG
jgi:tRNA A-37 threonylcarbamoyl transferase component Bud32/tetratricopeptide (TPR) repeat protein